MANNILIPATGSGAVTPNIATDDVSSVHYQYVKLVDGTAGSIAKIGGDATNGLDVDVTRVPTDPFGANADAAVVTDADGSISAKLRGTVKLLAAAISSGGGYMKTQINPNTSGGLTTYHVVSAASTNAVRIKSTEAQVYGWNIYNNAAYPVYVKLYNATTNPPVPGTTTVFKTIGIPAGGGNNFSTDVGIPFSTALGISILKDIADSGTTAVAASDCVVDLSYK